jgi:hypothetical protein
MIDCEAMIENEHDSDNDCSLKADGPSIKL